MNLILTCQPGESIRIGDDVTVTIVGLDGSRVHIGIGAPREIPVHREEIAYRRGREASATSQPAAAKGG